MIRQCFLTNTGILFHAEHLRSIGLDPSSLYPVVKERPEALHLTPSIQVPDGNTRRLTEEEEDLADALSPMYDQLSLARWWWSLEFLPIKHRVQNDVNEWETSYMYVPRSLLRLSQNAHAVWLA
jgi:hypothetical protein